MRSHVKPVLMLILCLLGAAACAQSKPVVVLLATGGTIAMKIDPAKQAPVPAMTGEDLLASIPQVTKTHTSTVETFKSGDFGFLGEVDEDRIVYWRAPLRRQHLSSKAESPVTGSNRIFFFLVTSTLPSVSPEGVILRHGVGGENVAEPIRSPRPGRP